MSPFSNKMILNPLVRKTKPVLSGLNMYNRTVLIITVVISESFHRTKPTNNTSGTNSPNRCIEHLPSRYLSSTQSDCGLDR